MWKWLWEEGVLVDKAGGNGRDTVGWLDVVEVD